MSIKKKPSEPEAHVDFIGVLKPEHEPFLVKPDPTNINYILFTKGEIPEHILQGIQNYYLDPSRPKPKLLENILSFERSNLLPPPEHTRLKRRLEERFPGLLQELINREGVEKATETLQKKEERPDTQSPKPSLTTFKKILFAGVLTLIVILLFFTPIGILIALVINYLFFRFLNFLYTEDAAAIGILLTVIMFLAWVFNWLIKKFKRSRD
ncbi:MAG TPA: EI24 domain-containing protein [Candidatus Brocadiales bacterium]|nr:EI24 domain-containing protein [Candidatus Brocadiales bacterium]